MDFVAEEEDAGEEGEEGVGVVEEGEDDGGEVLEGEVVAEGGGGVEEGDGGGDGEFVGGEAGFWVWAGQEEVVDFKEEGGDEEASEVGGGGGDGLGVGEFAEDGL